MPIRRVRSRFFTCETRLNIGAQPNLPRRLPSRLFRRQSGCQENRMLDALMLAAGLAFFAIAGAYVAACDRM
jgi:hypothetical protein